MICTETVGKFHKIFVKTIDIRPRFAYCIGRAFGIFVRFAHYKEERLCR